MPIVKGIANWVKGAEGKQEKYDEDDEFAAWSMQLTIDEATAKHFEMKGVNVNRDKVTGEPFIRPKRKEAKKERIDGVLTDNIIKMDPPKAFDENLNPIDINTIGNGSPCYVDYWVSTPSKKSYKAGVMWEGIQVDTRTMQKYQQGLGVLEAPLGTSPTFSAPSNSTELDDSIPF